MGSDERDYRHSRKVHDATPVTVATGHASAAPIWSFFPAVTSGAVYGRP